MKLCARDYVQRFWVRLSVRPLVSKVRHLCHPSCLKPPMTHLRWAFFDILSVFSVRYGNNFFRWFRPQSGKYQSFHSLTDMFSIPIRKNRKKSEWIIYHITCSIMHHIISNSWIIFLPFFLHFLPFRWQRDGEAITKKATPKLTFVEAFSHLYYSNRPFDGPSVPPQGLMPN